MEALNDITSVNTKSKEICENMVGLTLVNMILDLAINIKVVTQIDNRISVLDIESIIDKGEINVICVYWVILIDMITILIRATII